MRSLTVALVVLLSAASAHAVPITGYASGVVTVPRSFQAPIGQVPYFFALGESVSVRYTYNDEWPAPIATGVGFQIATSGGYTFEGSTALVGSDVQFLGDGGLSLGSTRDRFSIGLLLLGGVGRLEFFNELPGGGYEAFIADVTRTADPATVPEPSTLMMGLAGAALAGLGWTRRRRAA